MSQVDIFAALQGGAHFDRHRFKRDIEKFAAPSSKRAATSCSGSAPRGNSATASSTASKGAGKQGTKRAKKAKATTTIASYEEVGTVDVFSRSNATAAESTVAPKTKSASTVRTQDPLEEANVLRKQFRIRVRGPSVPDPLKAFEDLSERYKAPKRLLANLYEMGYQDPTAIQRQATPALMEGHELLAIAPTGSGKTLGFLIPTVLAVLARRRADGRPAGISAVVVSPTRELAAQTARCLALLTAKMGIHSVVLAKSTAAGCDFAKVDILLATPLRLTKLAEEGRLDLTHVSHLVLDEADRLFDLGFLEQVDGVIAACSNPKIVRALFSATLPEKVEEMARNVLGDPIRITVGERNAATSTVEQSLKFVGSEDGRVLALKQLLTGGIAPPVLVFVASKDRAMALHKQLMYDKYHVDCIHSDQSQAARSAAVEGFRAGRTWVLIATDLVGRGMDFLGVNTVVNFDFPNTTTDYIHRIGRTGRAGHSGSAVTFFTEEDAGQLRSVANVICASGGQVPGWMLTLKKADRDARPPPGRADASALEGIAVPKYDRQRQERRRSIIAASKKRARQQQ